MGLGTTFTNSIVREIGRNYGKSISNSLLGNAHSTPIRYSGGVSGDITRKRGRKYENKLDELLQKLMIKSATATLNQGQNIFNAYFDLVEEARADEVIDLKELVYLSKKYIATKKALGAILIGLKELGDDKKAAIIEQKISDLNDFIKELNDSLQAGRFEVPGIFTKKLFLGFFTMLYGLDRVLYYPKEWGSYFWLLMLLLIEFSISGIIISDGIEGFGFLGFLYFPPVVLVIYWLIINPIRKQGVWKYLAEQKRKKKVTELTIETRDVIQSLVR